MKKLIIALFLLSGTIYAQHTRQTLLQPDYDSYNLHHSPRQITVVQQYSTGQDINFQENYLFDSTGNLTQYTKTGFGGRQTTQYPLTQLNPRIHYDFDYDGDILRMVEFDLKNRLISSKHYIYGVGGNLIQTIKYSYNTADSGTVMEREVALYDKNARPVSIKTYSADELLLVAEKIKYDRRGNDVQRRITVYDEASTTVTIERRKYTYDRYGNWTKCSYSLDGKSFYTIERTFEYYGD
ncbi:MAG: hypothetical protein J6X86_08700 [Bacteroidales bacterium]|nr:hypothetical protein [Bacteroidales bacterium]